MKIRLICIMVVGSMLYFNFSFDLSICKQPDSVLFILHHKHMRKNINISRKDIDNGNNLLIKNE